MPRSLQGSTPSDTCSICDYAYSYTGGTGRKAGMHHPVRSDRWPAESPHLDPRLVLAVQGWRNLGRLHPLIKVRDVPIDVAEDIEHLGDPDLVLGFAGVLPDCRDDLLSMLLDS